MHDDTVIVTQPSQSLKRKAHAPGGMTRQEALSQAQAVIDDIQDEFVEWSQGDVLDLERYVTEMRAQLLDPEVLQKIEQDAGFIGEQGSTFGYHFVTQIGNSLASFARFAGQNRDIPGLKDQISEVIQLHVKALHLTLVENDSDAVQHMIGELKNAARQVVERAAKKAGKSLS